MDWKIKLYELSPFIVMGLGLIVIKLVDRYYSKKEKQHNDYIDNMNA